MSDFYNRQLWSSILPSVLFRNGNRHKKNFNRSLRRSSTLTNPPPSSEKTRDLLSSDRLVLHVSQRKHRPPARQSHSGCEKSLLSRRQTNSSSSLCRRGKFQYQSNGKESGLFFLPLCLFSLSLMTLFIKVYFLPTFEFGT